MDSYTCAEAGNNGKFVHVKSCDYMIQQFNVSQAATPSPHRTFGSESKLKKRRKYTN
jgi:hypothetical protein